MNRLTRYRQPTRHWTCGDWWRGRRRIATLLVVLAFGQIIGSAQQADPDGEEEEGPAPVTAGRFHVGLRVTRLLTPVQRELSATAFDAAATPPTSTLTYSNSAKLLLGGGLSVQVNVTPKLSVNVDYLYRRFGFDSGVVVTTQGAGGSDGAVLGSDFERTRGDLWDLPVMLRYYQGPGENLAGRRLFLAGGASFRRVTGVQSFNERIDANGLSNSNTTPTAVSNRMVTGATGGFGLQFRRQSPLRLDVELRYTRWLRQMFDRPTAQSNPNQVEAMVGLLF